MVRLRSVTGTHDRCGCQLRGSRVKSNRVFYRPAPERLPGQKGASRKDGERFQCSDERTHGQPDETWEGTDDKGAKVEVRCWNHLHLRTARWVELSLIQVIRHGASGSKRDPRISWFVWKGNQSAPLAEIRPIYRLRYSHEHGYRFDKQELLWDAPRFSTPERTECWTQLVACAHNLLVLARPLVEGCYRPWENRRSELTLTQVRRAMPSLLCQLGTPARPPKPRWICTRTGQSLSSQASNSLSGHSQNEQQAEKAQKGSLYLRFLVGFSYLRSSFLDLSHDLYGSVRFVLV